MRINRAQLLPVRLPLTRPVVGAHGVVTERECTLLRVETDLGLVGLGEASPYPGFGDETVQGARGALANASRFMVGSQVEEEPALDWVRSLTARAAIETALLDLAAQQRGVSLCEALVPEGGRCVRALPCNALVVGQQPNDVEDVARRALAAGFETFKLKVGGQPLEHDLARVARLREVIGSRARIRLDANQAYAAREARAALDTFAAHDIEYLEQPVAAAAIETLAALRRDSPIRLAADESALGEDDVRRLLDAGAADVFVVKPSAAGGPRAALRIARAVRAAGLEVVVTSLLDSAVGIAMALHSAAAIESEGKLLACGLATQGLFEFDVASLGPPLGGAMRIPQGPGLGIEVDAERLARSQESNRIEVTQ